MGIGRMCTGVVVFRSGNNSYFCTAQQKYHEIKFTVNWASGTKFINPIKSHLPSIAMV